MNLVQKEFSYAENYEEQREYGFLQDVGRSGLKRTMKRNIGRARTKVADKIGESIDKDFLKQRKLTNELVSDNPNTDSALRNKLIRRAKTEDNTRVISGRGVFGKGMDSTQKTSTLKKDIGEYIDDMTSKTKEYEMPIEHRDFKRFQNALKGSEENLIMLPSKDSTILSHELGHIENKLKGNKVQRYINKKANSSEVREGFSSFRDTAAQKASDSLFARNKKQGFEEGKGSIREAVKRYLNGKLIEKEEANASRRGLQMLKENGATKEQLKEAKDLLGKALESYKLATRASVKSQLRNKIAIPSRRK